MGKKIYKFKAESQEDRDKWVQIIRKAMNSIPEEQINEEINKMGAIDLDSPNISSFAPLSKTNKCSFLSNQNFGKGNDENERETMASMEKKMKIQYFQDFFFFVKMMKSMQ